MAKIYTKTGDSGTTSLFGGQRVDKNSVRIKAFGEVDELNSLIGVILAELDNYSSSANREVSISRNSPQGRIINKLLRIQKELFVLGSDLSTPADIKAKVPRIKKSFVVRLEREIDKLSASLPVL